MSKLKSQVWNYFERLLHEEVKCGLCGLIQNRNGGSTGDMIRHLQKIHQINPLKSKNSGVRNGSFEKELKLLSRARTEEPDSPSKFHF